MMANAATPTTALWFYFHHVFGIGHLLQVQRQDGSNMLSGRLESGSGPDFFVQESGDFARGLPLFDERAIHLQVCFRKRPIGWDHPEVLELATLDRFEGESERLLGPGDDLCVIQFGSLPCCGIDSERSGEPVGEIIPDPTDILVRHSNMGPCLADVPLVPVPNNDRSRQTKSAIVWYDLFSNCRMNPPEVMTKFETSRWTRQLQAVCLQRN